MLVLDILFEDDNLIAVNKPSGLLVVPDRWDPTVPTIQDMLREYLRKHLDGMHPNIRVIHRLDKDTSGVVVLAKNVKAQSFVGKQFENGEVDKTYHCIVSGVISKDEGVVNLSLSESQRKPGIMVVDPHGKKCITLYRVLERFDGFTYVEAKPLTGRTHQVRVHMKGAGFPLAMDPIYNDAPAVFLSQLKRDYHPKNTPEKPLFSRLPLHAFRISFREPAAKSTVILDAPLPKDFQRMLKLLRKYRSRKSDENVIEEKG